MPLSSLLHPSEGQILAALPAEGGYFSILKLVLLLLAIILWAYTSVWAQKACKRIRVHTKKWTYLTWGAGVLSFAVWLVIPWYWIGLILYAAIFGGAVSGFALSVYNPRVPPSQAVLTMTHLSRLGKGGAATKKPAAAAAAATDVTDRTRTKNSAGQAAPWPSGSEERNAFRALQDLLFDAIWRRASDVRLDLIPQQPLKVIFKIDGFDRAREPLSPEVAMLVFNQLKQIAGMDPEEHRRPQQGQFKAAIGAGEAERKADFDARASGSTAGQRMVLRLITEEGRFRLPSLGLTKEQLTAFEAAVGKSKGAVICSGPRGSGITSTLYTVLRSHDAFLQHVHTLEIAKATDLDNITQHVFDGQDGGVSFGNRFRSVLRAEPDVCMASDVPDAETARYAAAAARQGKKIYLGMNAKDSFTALRRYLEGVEDNALAGSSLIAVSNQRLIRILCPSCRRAYKPDPKLLKKGNLPTDENRPFYRPPNPNEIEVDKRGNQNLCQVCEGSGYVGRTGVFELLILDKELRVLIAKGTALSTVKVEARKKGMQYLQEVALRKVYDGLTSIQEVLRVTKDEASPSKAAG